ncbi:hypothetical protein DPMN_071707 [Dreissena polymorpha]|uniref:Uncharacterized protein n=1 Tax=Dreissena polymorpha TaxID=45954 RepID=A0A9D3Z7H2_DREPO|nr:hypothetical protein DPMN_071707 [Dreissena polymorpha]
MAYDEDAISLRSLSPISVYPDEITNTTLSSSTINKPPTTRTSTPVQEPFIIVNAIKHNKLLILYHYLPNFLHLFPHPRFKPTPLLFKILKY